MYNTPLEPGTYYHVFNHAVGDDSLFRQADNYRYFLERYRHYMFPVVRTYAYCLMPNHFHILIQVREENELLAHFGTLYPAKQTASLLVDYPAFVMQQFSNLFNSYAKAFNRRFDRKGALFLNYVRRKQCCQKLTSPPYWIIYIVIPSTTIFTDGPMTGRIHRCIR